MADRFFSPLDNRGVVSVSGKDAASFLQGLVSNDVDRVSESRAIWAAFLTPQGKFLHEFMIVKHDDGFLLDCERDRRDDLITRLTRFRLRAKVDIKPEDDGAIAAAWGDDVFDTFDIPATPGSAVRRSDVIIFADPRLTDIGVRLVGPPEDLATVAETLDFQLTDGSAYDQKRIELGLPDGSRDLDVEKALLLENGFEELAGVDFDKGCYIGQELTARTHYRALIKKRLLPVKIDGPVPDPGAPLTVDGKHAGEMRSAIGSDGLALVRLGVWQSAPGGILMCGDSRITPTPAPWMTLPKAP